MDETETPRDAQTRPFRRETVEGVSVEMDLEDGLELDGLKFIHTPGHSPGHVCIGVGNVLLSADHLLAQTIPQQWPESSAPFTGFGHYLDSLDKIQRIDGFDLALAAHEQVIHHVSARIDTIRAAHLRRLDRLLDMMRQARADVGRRDRQRIVSRSDRLPLLLAVTDVGSRVEYLHRDGHLAVVNLEELDEQEQPVFRYGAAP